jgi:SAM-dependent methyltransferase
MDLKEIELGVDPKTHWYYQSKKQPLLRFVKAVSQKLNSKLTLIDVGSGSGFFMYELMEAIPDRIEKVWLVDIGYTDEEIAVTKGKVIEKRKNLPSQIQNGIYVMMDVLEHLPDDKAMLLDIKNSCSGNNYFFITVPAFQSLWSGHDVYLEHYRRYKISTLSEVLSDAGYKTDFCYYIYNSIFPLVWLVRRIGNKTYKPRSNMKPIHPVINFGLKTFHIIENGIGKWNKLFGVTCVAEGKI